ncbi:MAG: phage protein [Rhodospirillales bacterium]
MATLSTYRPTLADHAREMDPNGSVARAVQMLNEINPILDLFPFFEGNLTTGHRETLETELPEPVYRLLNQGVAPTKGQTRQVDFTTALLEDWSEIDKEVADLNGNSASYRMSIARRHIQGMSHKFARGLWYGNQTVSPEEFTGLSYYYNDKSGTNGENILDGGGNGADNASIWLLVLDRDTIFGIYPKGMQAGLQHDDEGLQISENAGGAGRLMKVYRDHFVWRHGLVVRDWRYAVRIANIDVSNLNKEASGGSADLVDLMTKALDLPPSLTMGNAGFYMNRTLRTALRQQMNHQKKDGSFDQVMGKRVEIFDEVPVYRTDSLLSTEAVVPG